MGRAAWKGEFMGNRLAHLLAALLGASVFMLAGTVLAGEIRVMSSNAFRQAYLELVPDFEKTSGHKVVTSFVGGWSSHSSRSPTSWIGRFWKLA